MPVYYNRDTTGRPQKRMGEYRDAATRPMFNFGYGLHGWTMRYSPVTISSEPGKPASASFGINNAGTRRVEEVVQLYIRQVACAPWRPPHPGVAWISAGPPQPGESKSVRFELTDSVLG